MLGTYYENDEVIIFTSIHKDAKIEERLNYNDKFLTPSVFQWESVNNVGLAERERLSSAKRAQLFIRKVESENGITLPFIYVGAGDIGNPRDTARKAILFDIKLDNELPDYLQYDFGLAN